LHHNPSLCRLLDIHAADQVPHDWNLSPFARLDGCGADAALVGLAKACLAPAPGARPADAAEVAGRVNRYRDEIAARQAQAESGGRGSVRRPGGRGRPPGRAGRRFPRRRGRPCAVAATGAGRRGDRHGEGLGVNVPSL
jgi:hypothetical protein